MGKPWIVVRRSSRVLAVGLVILVLGFGNWAMASRKLEQYHDRMDEAVALGGIKVMEPFRGTASILEEQSDVNELFEDARARYDYYKLVRRGGRFFMAVGGAITLAALVRLITVPLPARYRTD